MKNKYSLILQDGEQLPKYYSVSKKLSKFLILGLPTLVLLLCLILLGIMIYFKQIKTSVIRKEPQIIRDLKQERKTLADEVAHLKKSTVILQNKLSQAPSSGKESLRMSELNIFKSSANADEMYGKTSLVVEDIEILLENPTAKVNLKLVNNRPSEKAGGFLFIILRSKNTISFWPPQNLSSTNKQLQFNKGESFSINSFRNIKGLFKNIPKSTEIIDFEIIIFSKAGDLIYKKKAI